MSFDTLGLHQNILKGIHDLGFIRPTPVQKEAIPAILAGKDVIACAQTGTGKTAAFVLPVLHKLLSEPGHSKHNRVLIVAPTRELAMQSMQHLQDLSRYVPLKGHAIYGGVPMGPQIKALKDGVDIISATPGRLLDHVYEGRIDFGHCHTLVLDEADRMLDMGFLPDVKKIISLLPPKRQNLIFSATMPPEIMKLVEDICHHPVVVQIGVRSGTPTGIRHAVYPVSQDQKPELLLKLLRKENGMSSVLVFTRTKSRAERLSQSLDRAGIRTSVLHGDRSQSQRMRALDQFKQGRSQVLVATDVAARGIDVKDISHVINFDVPQTPEDYIHRIGRTARAETTGDAFSLVAPDEEEMIREIEKAIQKPLPRVTLPDFNYRKPFAQSGHSHPSRPHGPSRHGGSHSRAPHRPRR